MKKNEKNIHVWWNFLQLIPSVRGLRQDISLINFKRSHKSPKTD